MRILVCGLPGTGKTHLSRIIANAFDCMHFDADVVRTVCSDWDFSTEGRARQVVRMAHCSKQVEYKGKDSVCSFVAPTNINKTAFDADILIYCNGNPVRHYQDTADLFEPPVDPDATYNIDDGDNQISGILSLISEHKKRATVRTQHDSRKTHKI